jgi:prolyl oligopeptidase
VDSVVDDYHGTRVADPYRWMEDAESQETVAWVDAQNRLLSKFMESAPARKKIEARLTRLWDYAKYSVPTKEGDRYYFSRNDGLQNQSVLYMLRNWQSEPKVVIDPNVLSRDGTIALSAQVFSKDGRLLAYGLSARGSDQEEIRIRNVDTGKDYLEVLLWCKFTGIAWKHDNSGFYYNRYPEPGSVSAQDQHNYNRLYWHALGTPQDDDVLIYERPDAKEYNFSPSITEDGKYLVLDVWHGTEPKNRLYYREVTDNGEFVRLLDEADAQYSPIGNDGSTFYIHTNLAAPHGRVIAIDVRHPERVNWKVIIPEREEIISFVSMVNNQFVVAYMQNAHQRLKIYDLRGTFVREIELPTIGSIAGLSGRPDEPEMFVGFTSFLYPTTIFRYDFNDNTLSPVFKSVVDVDPSGYETRQVFYNSKDGTRVSMFVVHKKGLILDGNNPTLMYGYGGFNFSVTPTFSVTRLIWMEHGGVYAAPNLRGGDEYGEAWHRAGILENKQNVFDDFIAAGEWLIKNGYTRQEKLAIIGGSNGGLLVTACMLQRPDLFGAVVGTVPVTDMLRYHKFTVGRYWVGEYGNAEENPEHFRFLYAYSPLHNVKKEVAYPPTLITTADTDDRVVPAHAKKFVATLQAADAGKNPILLRVETAAGHGGGKPTSKRISEQVDIYTFLFKVLGISAGSTN